MATVEEGEAADLAAEEPEPDIQQPQLNPEQVVHMFNYFDEWYLYITLPVFFSKVLMAQLLPCFWEKIGLEIMLKNES